MKSFKDYIIESKQTYDFKIKIAGECPEDCTKKLKEALSQYNCNTCSQGIRTPIQETQVDFPEQKNVSVTVFEVSLDYPTTSEQIRNLVANKLDITQDLIRVRNPLEEQEAELNHENDKKSGESILSKEYDKENHQDLVGETSKLKLLKELSKIKTQGTQYKGVNDKLLAKKAPSEKSAKAEKLPAAKSPISGKGK